MKHLVILLAFFFFTIPVVFAQGEIDDETKIIFRNERTVGFSLNSNGFGMGYRYGRYIDGFRKWLYQTEVNIVKHPKEIQSSSYLYNKKFVFGKLNNIINLRLSFGYQKEVYSKGDKGGVAIRYFGFAGPTVSFLKPILYEVDYYNDEEQIEDFETYYEKNINSHYAGDIIGKSSFFDGIEKTKIKPGVHLSGGIGFEYASKDAIVNALELGVSIDAFAEDIPIMFSESGNYQQLFVNLFLTYRFGKILDDRAVVE